jgi:DNA-binding PadR family transcriptional regulator
MTADRTDPRAHLPLSEVVLHTLLSLADEERHGYAIAQATEARTGGRVRLGPGTLYGCLRRLRAAGWIEESDGPDDAAHAEQRRTYRLTAQGRTVLQAEAQRLAAEVELLRAHDLLGGR